MRRHKILVAQIILLILSVINFALAAPVSVRWIAEDVTTASWKRWNPSDEWWTNSADKTNTPTSLGSSDSDYRLEQELRPHDPRSPMDSNASPQPQPSLGSTHSEDSHLLPAGSPPPHNNLPDLNDAPQPIQEPADSPNFGSNGMGPESPSDISSSWYDFAEAPSSSQPHDSNPPPPQDIGLHRPVSSPEPTDDQSPPAPPSGPESSSDVTSSWYGFAEAPSSSQPHDSNPPPPHDIDLNRPVSSPEPTDDQSPPAPPSGPESSSDSSSLWYDNAESPSSSQSHDFNPPPPQDIDLNRPVSNPEPTDDQPPPVPPSDPGSSKRPSSPSDDPDPGPSKRPYNPTPDPGPSTWGLGPEPSTWSLDPKPSTWSLGPEPSTWALGPSDPGLSKQPYVPSDPGPSTWAYPPSDPGPSSWAYPPSDPGPSTWAYPPSDPGPSTRPYPPSDPGPSTSDPGPSTSPYPPSNPRPSTSDPGPSILPPSSSGSLQHESENVFSELFRGSRFKRRISGSRSVNAA